MSLGLEVFKSRKINIYEEGICYKSFFKTEKTITFNNVNEMTATFMHDRKREYFYLDLYDSDWHYIKLRSFKREVKFEILNFMHRKLTPIVIPKYMKSFEKGNEINLGLLSVNKNIGIVRTNNIFKEIKWDEIDELKFKIGIYGLGSATLKYGNEVFEFSFEIGSLRQHTLLLEIVRLMVDKEKIKGDTNYSQIDFSYFDLKALKFFVFSDTNNSY